MHVREWLDRLAPDLITTLRRFPFASLLIACTTVAALVVINEFVALIDDVWLRIVGGLATGAVFAVAGSLFVESRPQARVAGLVLAYLVPLLAVAAFQIRDTSWFVPWGLPAISILWLSVSAFTGTGAEREAQQERFWWLNHQAAATALIAGVAFALIGLGLVAIERSLSILFGLDVSDIFYRWVLPVIGLLFTPLYWLATIPRLDGFEPRTLREPDLIARAIGFLGQFVLTPLLLAYALILLAYTVQIVVTQSLPQGMLGWMVLGFVTTGAATWLLVYPPFMRERLLVRVLRRWWFWLTIIPLGLYALAVGIRIHAYGLTPERMLLVAGGLWAAVLTIVFLAGRGDIRFIPGLAALVLLVLSIGPWSVESLPRWNQASTLEALLTKGGITGPESKPDWTKVEAARAMGAMEVLFNSDAGRADLQRVFAAHGVPYELGDRNLDFLFGGIGPNDTADVAASGYSMGRDLSQPVDVSATPYLIGRHTSYASGTADIAGLTFALSSQSLAVKDADGAAASVDIAAWLAKNKGTDLSDPVLAFTLDGTAYRYVVDLASITPYGNGQRGVTYLDGTLFADKPVAAKPKP